MKISFDFDGTLSLPWVQEIAKSLLKDHIIVCTTSRERICYNNDLFEIINKLDIEVYFTEQELKNETLVLKNVDIHFDDDLYEVDEINKVGIVKGILLNYKYYEDKKMD